MRIHVLRNPVGGSAKSRRSAARTIGRLRGLGHSVVELTEVSAERSSTALALAVKSGEVERLLVAGGDGLLHLAIQHVAQTSIPIVLAPTGTGNDFATALGVGADADLDEALSAPPSPVDLLRISGGSPEQATEVPRISGGSPEQATEVPRISGGSPEQATEVPRISGGSPEQATEVPRISGGSPENKWVASIAIAGFPADINARANRMSLPIGRHLYTLAAALELPRFRRRELDLRVDDESLSLDTAMLAIGNTSLFGGGMLACPDARATDGKLHLTSIDGVGRLGVLRHLQGRAGGTADRPEVIRRVASTIVIDTPGVEIWGDGEPITTTPTTIEVVPGAVQLAGFSAR